MTLRWAATARADYMDYLRYLRRVAPESARRAAADVESESARLEKQPFTARPSRWPGMREWSLLRWKKIIVFRIDPEEIVILGFLDARQDLRKIIPKDD